MRNTKNLLVSLLVLTVAGGIGWGTYTISGPSNSVADEPAGHGREAQEAKKDPHAHAQETSDRHNAHGDEKDDEDLEALFANDGEAGEHAGHDHGADEICPEHNIAEGEDALCQPDLVAHLQPGQGLKVRLTAAAAADRIGITIARPLPVGEEGRAWPGQVVFNRDRLARLSAPAGGTIHKINAGLGDKVGKGQLLAEIASPEAAGLRSELAGAESRRRLAEAVYLREKDLLAKGITSQHEFQQAEADFRQAESGATRTRQQAQDFGLGDGGKGSMLSLRAPFAGTVIERAAVVGEIVSPGTQLFALADLNNLWVEISVPEDALLAVQAGMEIVASFPGLPGRAFPGKIFWLAPALDERTRMLKLLAEVDNRAGLLRSGLFGQVRPALKSPGDTLAVPADAVQMIDGNPYLFLQLEKDLFELRRVLAGRRSQGAVVIQAGLQASDRVVTGQAFSLKSEVLRARLGASCADH
jgi:cobalt-zinc-cadmium efflux system membrane fusion protein